MYHFSITEPFNLNWKYVAPKDFDTLELFVKPGLSLELHRVSNGPKKFSIGAYLMNGNHRNKFNSEVLPARSDERVEKAFAEENVSVFFSAEDAAALAKLFEDEQFICREVKISSKDQHSDLFKLPGDEFSAIMDMFSELGVQQVADVKSSRELFEDLRTEAHKEADAKYAKEYRESITGGRTKLMDRAMRMKAAFGVGLLVVSGLANFGSKKLQKDGFVKAIGAIGLKIISSLSGVVGAKITGNAVEIYAEGMV